MLAQTQGDPLGTGSWQHEEMRFLSLLEMGGQKWTQNNMVWTLAAPCRRGANGSGSPSDK